MSTKENPLNITETSFFPFFYPTLFCCCLWFFFPSFCSFLAFVFEKHVKERYGQQRASHASARPALGLGLVPVCSHVLQECSPCTAQGLWVPLWDLPEPASARSRPNPAPHSTCPAGDSTCPELELLPFAYSPSLWICRLAVCTQHSLLSLKGKATPTEATRCVPALAHRRPGRKTQQ